MSAIQSYSYWFSGVWMGGSYVAGALAGGKLLHMPRVLALVGVRIALEGWRDVVHHVVSPEGV
jgi:hypothetical protein